MSNGAETPNVYERLREAAASSELREVVSRPSYLRWVPSEPLRHLSSHQAFLTVSTRSTIIGNLLFRERRTFAIEELTSTVMVICRLLFAFIDSGSAGLCGHTGNPPGVFSDEFKSFVIDWKDLRLRNLGR